MPEKGQPAATLEEAAKLLMIEAPLLPVDADQSAILPKPAAPTTPMTSDQSERDEAQVIQTTKRTTPATTADDESEPEISEEERKRRSFQAEAEQTKAKLAKLEADMQNQTATLNQQLSLEAEKNKMLMNMLAGVTALRGGEEPKAVNGKAKPENREPELSDFINLEEYDREEALDPRTTSGQAWIKYNRSLQRYEASQIVQEQQRATQEAQAREMTVKQARDFANAYPEFKNPFTGEPDLAKVNGWLENLSRTDWVTLKRALDGKPATNGTPAPAPPAPEAEIARRANKPASVAGKSSETPLPPARVSQEVATLSKIFGGKLSLPVDADI